MPSIVKRDGREIHEDSGERVVGMRLFAYGTLMWPEVLEAVIGRQLDGSPATLSGYLRLRVKGEHFPAVIPSEQDDVEGVLYENLCAEDFRLLDRFEGEEYDRKGVRIEDMDAQVYVLAARWHHLAEQQPWYASEMQPEHLAAFCQAYKGWRDLDDAVLREKP
jgi:gamma-glutamylcyclotransferase (GGCT)/AIG2-like uncharacterized protein YtfP